MNKALSLMIMAIFVLASITAYAETVLDENTIIKSIRPDTMTKAQIKEYYIRGRGGPHKHLRGPECGH
jgi:hypothetical protein